MCVGTACSSRHGGGCRMWQRQRWLVGSSHPASSRPTVESVSRHLAHASGRHVTVHWRSSGTCNPSVPGETEDRGHRDQQHRHDHGAGSRRQRGPTWNCAGVGLGGTLHTTLARPVAGRKIAHGKVTDHGAWRDASPQRLPTHEGWRDSDATRTRSPRSRGGRLIRCLC